MDKGKFVNLVKLTELGLFRANKQLQQLGAVSKEIEGLLQNICVIEQEAERSVILRKEFAEQMKRRQLVAQANLLFKQLEGLERKFEALSELQEKAMPFVERHRTARIHAFNDSVNAIKFARQLFEMFSIQEILFKPRFIGTIDLNEISEKLKLRKASSGLLLQPKDIKPFVKLFSAKRLASNICLKASGIKLQWQDRKTIAVEASAERLYRLGRLCNALQGKCLEK